MKRISTDAIQTLLKTLREETNDRCQRQCRCREVYDSEKRQRAARKRDPTYRSRVMQLTRNIKQLIEQMQRTRGGKLPFGARHSLDLPGITDEEAMLIIVQQDSEVAAKATRLAAAEKEDAIHEARYYWKDNDIQEKEVVQVSTHHEGPAVVMERTCP